MWSWGTETIVGPSGLHCASRAGHHHVHCSIRHPRVQAGVTPEQSTPLLFCYRLSFLLRRSQKDPFYLTFPRLFYPVLIRYSNLTINSRVFFSGQTPYFPWCSTLWSDFERLPEWSNSVYANLGTTSLYRYFPWESTLRSSPRIQKQSIFPPGVDPHTCNTPFEWKTACLVGVGQLLVFFDPLEASKVLSGETWAAWDDEIKAVGNIQRTTCILVRAAGVSLPSMTRR